MKPNSWLVPRPVFAPEGDAAAEVVMDEGADVVTETPANDAAVDDKGDKAKAEAPKDDVAADVVADDKGAPDVGDKTKDAEEPSIALTDEVRAAIAGDDADLKKLLGRYTSFKTMAQALKNAQAKLRSGKSDADLVMPDPKDEKAMAEYRRARGIPDDPTGYVLPEAVTRRMTDDDKPGIAAFTEKAHAKGAPQAAVDLALDAYFDMVEDMQAQRLANDKAAGSATEETLRADWGAEYKGNIKLAQSYVETIPGLGINFAVARLPDGSRLVDNPEFVTWAAEMGRMEFGDPVFANGDAEQRHNSRKTEIEGILKTDRNRYFKEGLDKEYGEILAKEEKRRK